MSAQALAYDIAIETIRAFSAGDIDILVGTYDCRETDDDGELLQISADAQGLFLECDGDCEEIHRARIVNGDFGFFTSSDDTGFWRRYAARTLMVKFEDHPKPPNYAICFLKS